MYKDTYILYLLINIQDDSLYILYDDSRQKFLLIFIGFKKSTICGGWIVA